MMEEQSSGFELAIVIPVWNDLKGLSRLLPQLLDIPQISEIIVVDDASDVPIEPQTLDFCNEDHGKAIVWLSLDKQSGAGHARNVGIQSVKTKFVLFFDSDDQILPKFKDFLKDLAAEPVFDFCMFRHVDSRMRAQGKLQPLESDQFHWDTAGIGRQIFQINTQQASRLCRVSAYPWNKIYRTDFLRENHIQCTETLVHNDIELHWLSFFRARNILASSTLCCEHNVEQTGDRLTNRNGAERFQVFRAIDAVNAELSSNASVASNYADAALEFYLNLFQWIAGILTPNLHEKFTSEVDEFLKCQLTKPFLTLAALKDPRQIKRLNELVVGFS